MPEEEISDESVANLLRNEAKAKSDKYSSIGLEAFLPKRSYERAPKPNKNFLRNIIRGADNHNAALLAKENAEAQAKLRTLTGEKHADSKRSKRYAKEDQDHNRKRSLSHDRSRSRRHGERRDASEERKHHHRKKHRRRAEESQEDNHHHHRHKRRHHEEDDDATERERHQNKRRRRYEDENRTENHADHHKRHKHLDEKRSEQKSRSRHSRRHRDKKDRDSSEAPDSESGQEYHRRKPRYSNEEGRHKDEHEPEESRPRRTRSVRETRGSDLLEELFGPHPPETASNAVRTKGRGTLTSATMDARFAEDYDPSMELQLDTDQNELEAMRDRQQWRLRGADRLRAAGFSEDVIRVWQSSGESQERNVEDVKWTKQGEAREWDRGKVVDEQGNVDLKPKWGD